MWFWNFLHVNWMCLNRMKIVQWKWSYFHFGAHTIFGVFSLSLVSVDWVCVCVFVYRLTSTTLRRRNVKEPESFCVSFTLVRCVCSVQLAGILLCCWWHRCRRRLYRTQWQFFHHLLLHTMNIKEVLLNTLFGELFRHKFVSVVNGIRFWLLLLFLPIFQSLDIAHSFTQYTKCECVLPSSGGGLHHHRTNTYVWLHLVHNDVMCYFSAYNTWIVGINKFWQ